MTQRRHFSRIPFATQAWLELNEQRVPAVLSDLSLKGVLLELPTATVQVGQMAKLLLPLGENEPATMSFECAIAHVHPSGVVGLRWLSTDLDSATHLRRLVELNLGDEALLQRELSELVHPGKSA